MRLLPLVQARLRGHVVIPSLLVLLSIFCLVGSLAPQFALSVFALAPGSTITYHFYLWNVVTGGLLEPSILKFMLCVFLIFRLGSALEQLWDIQRLGVFLAVTHVVTGASCFVLNLIRAMLTASSVKASHHLFTGKHYGVGGITFGIAVAYCLEWPLTRLPFRVPGQGGTGDVPLNTTIEDDIESGVSTISSRSSETNDGRTVATAHLISASLCGVVLVELVFPGAFFHDFQLILLQAAVSWMYLRFFQHHSGGCTGNDEPHFAFASFFPRALRPCTEPFSAIALRVFNCYGCLTANEGQATYGKVSGREAGASSSGRRNGSDMSVADRRRLRALKELDAKLAALADMPDIPLKFAAADDDDDDDDDKKHEHRSRKKEDDDEIDTGFDELDNAAPDGDSRTSGVDKVDGTDDDVAIPMDSARVDDHATAIDGNDDGGAGVDDDSFARSQRAVQAVLAAMDDVDAEDAGVLATDSDNSDSDAVNSH